MPIIQKLGREQRGELIEMLTAVAAADGRHDDMTTFDINHLSKKLGV